MEKNNSTEEKIKIAATRIFLKKGFAGARTRDIAQEAGINLALLNYYFRSKEKLFEMVMLDSVRNFFPNVKDIFNDEKLSIDQKLQFLTNKYIDLVEQNPNLPFFVLGEIQSNPDDFFEKIGVPSYFLQSSNFYRQIAHLLHEEGGKTVDTKQLFINILSMILFPFMGKPMINKFLGLDEDAWKKLNDERRRLIPLWIKAMIGVK